MKKLVFALVLLSTSFAFNSCGSLDYEDVESSIELNQTSPSNGEGEDDQDPPEGGQS